ncbi:MAG: AbrB/MazE/SpoVT family DNA-binding domain-containing protein [Thermomicrobiales bacterium]
MQLDDQGRVTLPAPIRARLGLEAGDTLFAWVEEQTGHIAIAKTVNAFDALYDDALEEYRAGRTVSLREFAAAEGIRLEP